MLVSDAWPAPATYLSSQATIKTNLLAELKHQAPITGRFVNTVTRGWSEPLTSAPRSDFMAQSLVLSIDVCSGLKISPFRTNIWLSFSQADLGPRSAQELLFSAFLKFETFFRRFVLIASGTEIFWRVSLKFELFWQHRVSIVTGLTPRELYSISI